MAATPEEEMIIRKRFLTQTAPTVAVTQPPFKKLVKKYMEYCQVLESGSVADAEKTHTQLLADLYTIQFAMQKLRASSGAFEREQAAYAAQQARLQESIQQAERDIEQRKQELVEARIELAHQQEYETVKRQVMQVPSRAATLAEQEAAHREIADLQQQSARLDALFAQRKQQFGGVLAALEQLQRCIERDEPEESMATLQDGGSGSGGGGGHGGGGSQVAVGGSKAVAVAAAAAPLQQQQQRMQVG